ncbi:MAG: ATP synthase subunit I [Acidobacteria bacterium]|nr:ATP synthase subunit I [Acidobacteriota bacterium]
MNLNEPPPNIQIPPEELKLLVGVEPRIFRTTLLLGIIGAATFWLWRGPGWATGFAIGASLSALSFQWMKTAINVLADKAISAGSNVEPASKPKRGTAGAVARFVLRYALIGIAGYVIFRSSIVSLVAFFAGLFVTIVAALVEVGYQIYLGFRSR